MPKSVRVPAYKLHKSSGQARVIIAGKHIYLGPYGSPESQEKYGRMIAEWKGSQSPPLATSPAADGLLVLELINAYRKWAEGYYVKDGKPTGQVVLVKGALSAINSLYGTLPIQHFGPTKLEAIQQHLIEARLSRGFINQRIGIIKRMFKWGVSKELVPPAVYQALATVEGLKKGRTLARETKPVEPVDDAIVEATVPHLPPMLADMVRLQRQLGCRPSEVCMIRPMDVNNSGTVWVYTPESHKTQHHERERRIYIGPKGQDILRPYLLRAKDAYCFSPRESRRMQYAAMRESRKTRVQPSQVDRQKERPKRQPGEKYTKNSYCYAIVRACELAFNMPKELKSISAKLPDEEKSALRAKASAWREQHVWSPNQLRHSVATSIRKRYGIEGAQVCLGHSKADVTQVYAERDFALAERIMREVG